MSDPATEDGLFLPVDEDDPVWENPRIAEMKGLAAMDGTVPVWGVNDQGFIVVHLVDSDQVMVLDDFEDE